MPITTVKGPDGKEYKVSHPEGATKEQIIAYAKSQKSPKQEQPKEKSLDDKRKEVAEGITLRPFGIDTGVEMPQWLVEGLAGAGKRLTEIGTLGTHEADPATKELLDASGYATAGEVIADIAAMAAGGTALRGAGAATKAGQAVSSALGKAPTTLKAMAGGSAYEAATNEDRGEAAIAGAVGGGVGAGIAKGLGKVIHPNVTAGAKRSIADGDILTPGEILGGSAKRIEDSMTSVPVVGDMIGSAKRSSVEQWNLGVVRDALKPIGASLPKSTKAGAEAIKTAQDIVEKQYDDILEGVTVKLDRKFATDVDKLAAMTKELPEKEAGEFLRIVKRELSPAFDNPTQTALGRTFKQADSSLRKKYQKLLRSNDTYQQELGKSVRELHKSMMEMAARQDPKFAAKKAQADIAYAKLKRIEGAANFAGAADRIFSPAHLLAEIRKNTSSKTFAAGEGFDQRMVEDAKEILSSGVPDSGTPGRLMSAAGLFGGAAMLGPKALMGIAAGSGLYTKPGLSASQAALTGMRGPGTQAARELLEQIAPASGLFGAALANQQ